MGRKVKVHVSLKRGEQFSRIQNFCRIFGRISRFNLVYKCLKDAQFQNLVHLSKFLLLLIPQYQSLLKNIETEPKT